MKLRMSTEPGRSGIESILCYYLCVFETRAVAESVTGSTKNTGAKEAALILTAALIMSYKLEFIQSDATCEN